MSVAKAEAKLIEAVAMEMSAGVGGRNSGGGVGGAVSEHDDPVRYLLRTKYARALGSVFAAEDTHFRVYPKGTCDLQIAARRTAT